MIDFRNALKKGASARDDQSAQPDPKRRYWGSVEPPTDRAEFFSAVSTPTADGTSDVATIRMYGPIDSWGGWWGISTEDVGRVLDALPESVSEIILRINSPGGEVWEAMAILNMLSAHRANVVAVIDGIAASAASFIAAGCAQTYASPGSQMMLHSPSSIAWGNAVEMRKTAAFLDKLEDSIIEVYVDKAGEKDWKQILADETWLTATETVEMGLADEVKVVPDAGTATTVGTDDDVVLIDLESDDDGDAEARSARVKAAAAVARAAAPKPPSSSEPGEPIREENVVAYDDLKAGFAKRLGITEAEVTDEMLLAALDETLAEQPSNTTTPAATVPEGTVVVDKSVWEETQANARRGAEAAAEQDKARREGIVLNALQTGRITTASADDWRARLAKDEAGFSEVLASLPENTVPVDEIGHASAVVEDDAYPAHWKR
ncbi:head maturation protease, ClpP-related [Microbacterium sp. NPDC080220]|uniref:head maturation protease, ClpP-related n=1 Tax=Microbacterium sp. NPDC080220 TaxID=3161017 RepID=UPI003439C663